MSEDPRWLAARALLEVARDQPVDRAAIARAQARLAARRARRRLGVRWGVIAAVTAVTGAAIASSGGGTWSRAASPAPAAPMVAAPRSRAVLLERAAPPRESAGAGVRRAQVTIDESPEMRALTATVSVVDDEVGVSAGGVSAEGVCVDSACADGAVSAELRAVQGAAVEASSPPSSPRPSPLASPRARGPSPPALRSGATPSYVPRAVREGAQE